MIEIVDFEYWSHIHLVHSVTAMLAIGPKTAGAQEAMHAIFGDFSAGYFSAVDSNTSAMAHSSCRPPATTPSTPAQPWGLLF